MVNDRLLPAGADQMCSFGVQRLSIICFSGLLAILNSCDEACKETRSGPLTSKGLVTQPIPAYFAAYRHILGQTFPIGKLTQDDRNREANGEIRPTNSCC